MCGSPDDVASVKRVAPVLDNNMLYILIDIYKYVPLSSVAQCEMLV